MPSDAKNKHFVLVTWALVRSRKLRFRQQIHQIHTNHISRMQSELKLHTTIQGPTRIAEPFLVKIHNIESDISNTQWFSI